MKATIKEKREVAKGTLFVTFDLGGEDVDFEPGQYFWVELLDPPYDDETALRVALEDLPPLVSSDAHVVAKHFWRTAPPTVVGLLASERERRFGETALTFYRRRDPTPGPEESTEDA